MSNESPQNPSLLQSPRSIVFLIGMLAAPVYLFGDGSSGGPSQIALVLSAAVTATIGALNGYSWSVLERGIVQGISLSLGAVLILLVVGSLIGSWILAGIVPTLI